jgi:hypothetical protein
MLAPTSKNSKVQYCPVAMTDRYKDWAPSWWSTWKSLGPPAGNDCSAVFMSECCGFSAVPNAEDIVPLVALDRHFAEQISNVRGLSREKAMKQRKEEMKKESGVGESSSQPTVHRPSQSSILINLEIRKERRLIRAQEIERLSWLIQRAAQTKDIFKQEQRQLELDCLYEAPLEQNESDYDAPSESLMESATPRSTPGIPAFCSTSVDVRQAFSPISKLCDKRREDVSPIEMSNLIFSPFIAVADSPVDQFDADADQSFIIDQPDSKLDQEEAVPAPAFAAALAGAHAPTPAPSAAVPKSERPAKKSTVLAPSAAPMVAAELDLDASANALTAADDERQRKKLFEEAKQMKHQTLFVKRVLCDFKRINILRDGHCLFHCFASFFNRHGVSFVSSKYFPADPMGVMFSAQIVRSVCADELLRIDGKIPGLVCVCTYIFVTSHLYLLTYFVSCYRFNPFDDDEDEQTSQRTAASQKMNITGYAEAVRKNLYGGDLEIATLAWLFKLKVYVYSHYLWRGSCSEELHPEVHVQESEAQDPEGGSIHLLFEVGLSGGLDHYSLIVPSRAASCEFALSASDNDQDDGPKVKSLSKRPLPSPTMDGFQKHAQMRTSLPRWNIDLKVVEISPSVGRGIVALRKFHKKEVAGIYDGHRCDDKGKMLC